MDQVSVDDLNDRGQLLRWLQWADVKLIDTNWLCKASVEQIMPRRQELPNKAFVPFKKLADGKPIVSLTYGWNAPAHPDPEGKYAMALKNYFREHSETYPHGAALFWDHKSVFQHKIDDAWAGNMADRDSFIKEKKTDEEKMYFDRAMGGMEALYFHACTEGIIMAEVPSEGKNPRPYEKRGWTAMECAGLGLSGKSDIIDLTGEVVRDQELRDHMEEYYDRLDGHPSLRCAATDRSAVRSYGKPYMPPMTPEDFEKELKENRTFTKGGDTDNVVKMYERGFKFYAKHATSLTIDMYGAQRYNIVDLLSGSLPHFESLEELHLTKGGKGRKDMKLRDVLDQLKKKGCKCYVRVDGRDP